LLDGRVAIITGSGRGIGREFARCFGREGAKVVVNDVGVSLDGRGTDEDPAVQVCKEIEALGGEAVPNYDSVSDFDGAAGIVHTAVDAFGTVDILVNNAGTSWGASPEEMPLSAWQKVIDVNLTGPFLFTQAAGIVMIREGGGKVINIASVAAFKGAPSEALNAIGYNASKGGLVSFTRDLAVKWAKYGINVNAIAPGWFPSEMSQVVLERSGGRLVEHIPLGRYGGDDDLKGAVAFLASAASDFVTGITLPVDGGELAR
jgi:gluconate 5-dehydrogenase